jgi:two-component system, chemotaxis family, protein-glutamate methylesterase/glutaminase
VSEPIRVLIVDDSAFMRKVIREMLERSPLIEVVGIARNGEDALKQSAELNPDVVTVDLIMPEMDGVHYIQAQMERKPIPVVVISSAEEGGELPQAALDAGAVEFVQKPTARALDKMYEMQQNLVRAIVAAGSIPIGKLPVPISKENPETFMPVLPLRKPSGRIAAVLLGISTGGPQALRALLPRFPANFPVALAITLHIPVGYTQSLAFKLSEMSQIEVVESGIGVEMKPGRAILSKAGVHTRLIQLPDGSVVTELSYQPKNTLYIPSVDELFRSGAEVYGSHTLGVVMTGMGDDGTKGAAWIKAQGGLVFAEAECSSIVYGMPRAVAEAGLVDRVVALEEMAEAIMEMIE